MELSWAAFEAVTAWLRGERVPRLARRSARRARRMGRTVMKEYARRDREDRGIKPGYVRLGLRRATRSTKSYVRTELVEPLRQDWRVLFGP